MTTKPQAPFRYDVVGSFLRPDVLKQARADHATGVIDDAALETVTDEAIRDLIAKQKSHGLHAVTDGEFRRRYWHLDFLAELEGVEEVSAKEWSVHFQGHQPKAATVRITDKVDFGEHPFLAHFDFTKSVAGDALVKQTIPSPSMLHLICCVREENYQPCERYAGDDDLLYHDIAVAYQHAIEAFYDRGCRYLQLDDTSWGEFCDAKKRAAYEERGLDIAEIQRRYVEMINEALEARPDDMVVTMHICRGNFRSTWFSSGGYDPVAKTLFENCKVDGFFLEYDSDRAGDFEPLAHIADQRVVLGLVTSKTPGLEDPDALRARIKEATKYVPLEQLCLSPQCGFASTEEGNILTEDEQWAKVDLIREVAESVWDDAK